MAKKKTDKYEGRKPDFLTDADHENDFNSIHFRKTAGKTIRYAYDADKAWKEYKTQTVVPSSNLIMNYDLKLGKRTILVLDNYGNDYLSPDIEERLLSADDRKRSWLLGIDRKTGEILTIVFYTVKNEIIAVFCSLSRDLEPELCVRVPKAFLKQLDNLKCKKRPWMLLWNHPEWLAFHTREYNWHEFVNSVTVHLDIFKNDDRPFNYLEVANDKYRVVSDWEWQGDN